MSETNITNIINNTPDGDTSWGDDMRGAILTLSLSDQAAATASRRTLGTGSTQAAAGNHTHPANVVGTGITEIVKLTSAAYTALTPKVATTLYVISG